MGMIATTWLLLHEHSVSKEIRMLWDVLLLIQSCAWLMADSRAAWLAVGIGISKMLLQKRQVVVRRQILLLTLSLVLLAIPIYLYKRSSADARFFIWKICTEMIQDAPLYGHGPQGVSHNFMHYQKLYLDEQGNDGEKLQATDNRLAFNEGVRLLCEYGICGVLLMGGLLVVVGRSAPSTKHPCLYLLVGFLLFSCFSYPSEIFSLSSLFMLLLGSLPQQRFKRKIIVRCRYLIGVLVLLAGTSFIYAFMCIRIDYALNHYYWDEKEEKLLSDYYTYFSCEHELVSRYARSLYLAGEYETAIHPLTRMTQLTPTVEIYCDLGYSHQQLGNFQQAEECFRYAVAMVPGRMTPHYYLFKLLHSSGDKERAFQEGKHILQMKVKIENKEVERMRQEVKSILTHSSYRTTRVVHQTSPFFVTGRSSPEAMKRLYRSLSKQFFRNKHKNLSPTRHNQSNLSLTLRFL